jgi:hypothetical protein
MEKPTAQDQDDRPLEELLASSFAEIGVRQSGREMIAAMRRGDREGAELALVGYLAPIEGWGLRDPHSVLGFSALALRELTLTLASLAAEEIE